MASVQQSQTVLEVQALSQRLAKDQPFIQKSYPVNANWASQLGHPCERFLYHNRKDWEQKKAQDWKGIGIRGNLIADWWKRYMSEKGYQVTQAERPLSQALRERFQISGKIDGRIGLEGTAKPRLFEFKTMQPYEFEKIDTYDDIAESRKDYIRGYIAQIQIYLYDLNEEAGLFVLCNASTLEWKTILVYLDYGYVEWLLQRAGRVNQALFNSLPPARIPYGKACQRCAYAHICLPDIKTEGLTLQDDAHWLELLKERETLKAQAGRYEELDKECKSLAKIVGKDCLVGGEFKSELTVVLKKRVNVKAMPIELRAPFEIDTVETHVDFVPLNQP